MSYTLETLPKKFESCLLKNEIPASEVEDWTLTLLENFGPLSLKSFDSTNDMAGYGLRKANKIRQYIEKNKLENDLFVREMHLYWVAHEHKFYLACKKANLANEVAKSESEEYPTVTHLELGKGEQLSLQSGAAERKSVTEAQAKALAELAVTVEYTHIGYNDIYFTKEGQVAILDATPENRLFKKKFAAKAHRLTFWDDIGAIKAQQTIMALARLKFCCSDPKVMKEVEKVERRYALKNIAKVIAKMVLCILIIAILVPNTITLSAAGIVAFTFKATLVTVYAVKLVFLLKDMIAIDSAWRQSCIPNEHGYAAFAKLRALGKI